MVDLINFKAFLGYGQEASPAVRARGTLTATRVDGISGIIPIPTGLLFSNSGNFYRQATSESLELSESAEFIPIVVEATQAGASGNLSRLNQPFRLSQSVNITVVNENPISGGRDAIAERLPSRLHILKEPDDRLQTCLNVGKGIIKGMIGSHITDQMLDDNEILTECVFLAASYRLKNTTTDENIANVEVFENRNFFRDRLFLPLFGDQIQSMIDQSGIERDMTAYA